MAFRIVVIGGYGNFGTRICRALSSEKDTWIGVAGRFFPIAASRSTEAGAHYQSARFDASLELGVSHFGLWMLAWLVRAKLVREPAALAEKIVRIARRLDRFGSNVGGMRVMVAGRRSDGSAGRSTWHLTARDGDGPEIPCIPAIVIARRLARGESLGSGAGPCVGMMTLEEFGDATRELAITWRVVRE